LATCRRRGVLVTNVPGGNAEAVAELALTLALTLLRRVKELDYRICSGEQVPSIAGLAPGLSGKTVGIVGMGDTAYRLALLLQPFGCRLMIWSPSSPRDRWDGAASRFPVRIEHSRLDSLEEMLSQTDLLSIHCPLTPSTKGLIGAKQLAVMRRGAVVINTARGGIIDELALTDALKEGRVGGAGLDVFETEPAYGENLRGLGKMLNVVCLPHMWVVLCCSVNQSINQPVADNMLKSSRSGGSTDQVAMEGCNIAVDIMADYLDGKGVKNRVVWGPVVETWQSSYST
jgi:D-3-phosphoglycerate dehydrogenase